MVLIYYIIMKIKSPQTLVQEALNSIKTLSPEEAIEKKENNGCCLIDIRDLMSLKQMEE